MHRELKREKEESIETNNEEEGENIPKRIEGSKDKEEEINQERWKGRNRSSKPHPWPPSFGEGGLSNQTIKKKANLASPSPWSSKVNPRRHTCCGYEKFMNSKINILRVFEWANMRTKLKPTRAPWFGSNQIIDKRHPSLHLHVHGSLEKPKAQTWRGWESSWTNKQC